MDNLIFQIQRDNEYAFKQLYQEYYAKVVTFIAGIIKKREIARDLAQDVFVNLWLNRKTLDVSRNLQNYLFVASRHAAINYLKKELSVTSEPIEAMHTDIGSDITVEDTLFAKEIRLLIEMIVSEMPEQRQRIYRMSREEGMSNEEIAGRLGISKRSVENQISLALKEIRQAVTAYVIFLFCMLS
ncbi:RNA polymerase sigma-70 factor [uncultured Phocaeicola sp.]|uniref:RNA polymerase sigma-70 factor n=1 Tax=uncultured Phocaeicola sp. TaxID=990718 RepID=UPI0025E57EF8|nr:RNA polymerase sigma-70 factor [uncultured Phocaeicola sp.]